jgi:molybdate transport system substrate-binding protein
MAGAMMRRAVLSKALLGAALLCAGALGSARAAEIRVLSGGAVEPGVRPVIAAFEKASGHTVALRFATAPQIRQRIEAGERFDVVIAPPAVLDALAARLAAEPAQRVPIGSVGLGVAVRPGAPVPDLSSAEAFRRALLEADSLVFNRASTGLYFEGLLKQLGIEAEAAAKTTRYADGASVMEHVLHGRGRELGIGAVTEIVLVRERGLQFVGPLPAALQNLTPYAASATSASPPAEVRDLLRQLASPDATAAYTAAGIATTR